MESILDFLDAIEDVLESCRTNPLNGRISLDKMRVTNILGEIRANLPNEIQKAHQLISRHDNVIHDANVKAKRILDEANADAARATNEHEIARKAKSKAQDIMDAAEKDARNVRNYAMDYVDEILIETGEKLREASDNMEQQFKLVLEFFNQTIDVINENRQQLNRR